MAAHESCSASASLCSRTLSYLVNGGRSAQGSIVPRHQTRLTPDCPLLSALTERIPAGAQPGGGSSIQVHQASAAAAPPATDASKQHIINRLQLHLDHSRPGAAVAGDAAAAIPWRLNARPSGELHQLCRQHRQLAADAAAQVQTGAGCLDEAAVGPCAAMLCWAGRTGHSSECVTTQPMAARLGSWRLAGLRVCACRSEPDLDPHSPARYAEHTCMSHSRPNSLSLCPRVLICSIPILWRTPWQSSKHLPFYLWLTSNLLRQPFVASLAVKPSTSADA